MPITLLTHSLALRGCDFFQGLNSRSTKQSCEDMHSQAGDWERGCDFLDAGKLSPSSPAPLPRREEGMKSSSLTLRVSVSHMARVSQIALIASILVLCLGCGKPQGACGYRGTCSRTGWDDCFRGDGNREN